MTVNVARKKKNDKLENARHTPRASAGADEARAGDCDDRAAAAGGACGR